MIEGQLKLEPLVSQAVVIGDRRKYITALIAVNLDVARKLLADRGESVPADPAQLSTQAAVKDQLQARVSEINRHLGSWEQVKYFRVLPRELTEADGELTPTLKVKRKVVAERYASLIDEMYTEAPSDKD